MYCHACNATNRNLRVADLRETVGSLERSVLGTLFDATLIKITAICIHMVGAETQCLEKVSTKYLHGWWGKPAS